MIKLSFLLIYNIIRFSFKRLRYWKRIKVHWLQRISPFCSLKIFEKGSLYIGRNCEFAQGCDFEVHSKGLLEIGEGTYFNRYCMISAHESVKIGDHCFFGPGVKIFDNNHKFSKEEGVSSQLSSGSITIGSHSWIASDVIILKNTHIGDNCVIGAGCVVQGDIPSGTLVRCSQKQEIVSLQ